MFAVDGIVNVFYTLLEVFLISAVFLLVVGGSYWLLRRNLPLYEEKLSEFWTNEKDQIIQLSDMNSLNGLMEMKFYIDQKIEVITQLLTPESNEESDEEGDGLQEYLEKLPEIIAAHVHNSVAELMQEFSKNLPSGILGSTSSSTEGLDTEKLDKAAANMAVNGVLDSHPLANQILLHAMGDDWKKQAQDDPRAFMYLVNKAQDMGLFNWLGSMEGMQKQITGTSTNNSKSSKRTPGY